MVVFAAECILEERNKPEELPCAQIMRTVVIFAPG